MDDSAFEKWVASLAITQGGLAYLPGEDGYEDARRAMERRKHQKVHVGLPSSHPDYKRLWNRQRRQDPAYLAREAETARIRKQRKPGGS